MVTIAVGLSACRKELPDLPEEPTAAEDEDKITLPEPITLTVSVAPLRIIDPTDRSAYSAYRRQYTDAEKKASTINTGQNSGRPSKPTPGDPDYAMKYHKWVSYGDDWVRTINIAGLKKGVDFTVEGLVAPQQGHGGDLVNRPDYFYLPEDFKPNNENSVKITFHKIRKNRELSIYANCETWKMYSKIQHLSDVEPLMIAENGMVCTPDVASNPKVQNHGVNGHPCQSLFEPYYLPMYAHLTHLSLDPDNPGKLRGAQLGESKVETLNHIYLERAVASVLVDWRYEDGVPDKEGDLIDKVEKGRYINVLSAKTNNWEEVLEMRRELVEKKKFQRKNEQGVLGWYEYKYTFTNEGDDPFDLNKNFPKETDYKEQDLDFLRGAKGIYQSYYTENFTTHPDEQSTLRVHLTHFKDGKIDKRNYRKTDLLFGEKNLSTGLYELHRNTLYHLHIAVRKSAKDFSIVIVDGEVVQPDEGAALSN